MDLRRERLSKFVRNLRGERSLRELARRLSLSVGTVTAWEDGKTLPDLDNLYKLANYAGISPDALLIYLDGGEAPNPLAVDEMAGRIRMLDSGDFAVIARVVVDRLAAS